MNKILVFIFLGLFMVSAVSAMTVSYYFHPQCGHCVEMAPFIQEVANDYEDITWNILDVSKGSYNIAGTPTMIISTNDYRKITLTGSYDIPKYLECELNEISTLDCQTNSYLNSETGSFFIR